MPDPEDAVEGTVTTGGPQPALDPERTMGVVGAGTMGAGIATVAACAGYDVLLYDADAAALGRAVGNIATDVYRRAMRDGRSEDDCSRAAKHIRTAKVLEDLAPARLVVEAIVESLPVKRELFAALEEIVEPTATLASNTSSLSITKIQEGMAYPGRMVGMHFFNPAPVLPLVEIVSGAQTDPVVASAVYDLATGWGKTPVHAASTPGFIVNRVARPFYGEAFAAYESGVADPATIDALLREAGGFRMGPFELTDLIGHDVNSAVSRSVWEQLGEDPRFTPSSAQRDLVAAGRLGRKTGAGWFTYGDGVQRPAPATWPTLDLPSTHTAALHKGGDVGLSAGGVLARTEGIPAAGVERSTGAPTVLFDLVGDPATATRVAVAFSPAVTAAVRDEAIGLLQAAGLAVSVIADSPGMIVARTLAMLVNVAADAVDAGVAEPAAVDLAMVAGVSYPRGPLEWGDSLGPAYVVRLLDNLAAIDPSGRYRVSPWLRSRADAGDPLR